MCSGFILDVIGAASVICDVRGRLKYMNINVLLAVAVLGSFGANVAHWGIPRSGPFLCFPRAGWGRLAWADISAAIVALSIFVLLGLAGETIILPFSMGMVAYYECYSIWVRHGLRATQ
jgi:hypothetical protein